MFRIGVLRLVLALSLAAAGPGHGAAMAAGLSAVPMAADMAVDGAGNAADVLLPDGSRPSLCLTGPAGAAASLSVADAPGEPARDSGKAPVDDRHSDHPCASCPLAGPLFVAPAGHFAGPVLTRLALGPLHPATDVIVASHRPAAGGPRAPPVLGIAL